MPNETTAQCALGEFLSRKEVAQLLKIYPGTVKRMEKAGRLTPYVFTGSLVRYAVDDVARLVRSARVPATT
jgi:predicted site-specific integrase-resolvase